MQPQLIKTLVSVSLQLRWCESIVNLYHSVSAHASHNLGVYGFLHKIAYAFLSRNPARSSKSTCHTLLPLQWPCYPGGLAGIALGKLGLRLAKKTHGTNCTVQIKAPLQIQKTPAETATSNKSAPFDLRRRLRKLPLQIRLLSKQQIKEEAQQQFSAVLGSSAATCMSAPLRTRLQN